MAAWGWLTCAVLLAWGRQPDRAPPPARRKRPGLPRGGGRWACWSRRRSRSSRCSPPSWCAARPHGTCRSCSTVARHQGHRATVQVISAFGSWEVVILLLCVTLGLLLGARLNRQAAFVVGSDAGEHGRQRHHEGRGRTAPARGGPPGARELVVSERPHDERHRLRRGARHRLCGPRAGAGRRSSWRCSTPPPSVFRECT